MLTILSQRRGQDGGMDYLMSTIHFIPNLRPEAAKSREKNERPPFEGIHKQTTQVGLGFSAHTCAGRTLYR